MDRQGAGVFKAEWAKAFADIREVAICFDRDAAGRKGAERVARLICHAKIVTLPDAVGPAGDVTDFFVKLGKRVDDFLALLHEAKPLPQKQGEPEQRPDRAPQIRRNGRIAHLKAGASIEAIVGQYVQLHRSGRTFAGHCCFHEDRVPSLMVYPDTQSFYCFGCQIGGDVIRSSWRWNISLSARR